MQDTQDIQGSQKQVRDRGAETSSALNTLRAFDISLEDVARQGRVAVEWVSAALSPREMENCPIIELLRVQCAAEQCLRQRGWRGDSDGLWQEYHELIRYTAEQIARRRCPRHGGVDHD